MARQRANLAKLFNLGFIILMLTIAVVVIAGININERRRALDEAKILAETILERNLGIHAYFNQELKPALFEWSKPFRREEYFEPKWMSSTYAIREIDKYYQRLSGKHEYYYKEGAINARSPSNEADDYEKIFIEKLNRDPELKTFAATRMIEGAPFYTVLHRGETMEKSCLRCHSTPENAPAELVEKYGPERSFDRYEGQVVSAISIRIPIGTAYAKANSASLKLSAVALLVISLIWAMVSYFNNRFLFAPIMRFQEAARRISEHPDLLSTEPFEEPFGEELSDTARAFNAMSAKVVHLNENLANELETVTTLNAERSKMIDDLQKALSEVEVLSGLLPICFVCKKVKDEDGKWTPIETFIRSRTEAEFTHGYCPECAKKALEKKNNK